MIVGLCGRKRSGKDTAAQALIQDGFTRLLFAGPLKDMLRTLLRSNGVEDPEPYIEGDLKEVPTPYLNGQTPRHAMQTLGTEWGRQLISDGIWVDTVMRATGQHQKVVITDVRFPNELDVVKAAGGIVVRITRGHGAADGHVSEAFIDELPVDFEIVNNASIADLHANIRSLLHIHS